MALFIPCRGELLCPSDWTIFEEKHGKPLLISKNNAMYTLKFEKYTTALLVNDNYPPPPPHPLECNSPS